MSPFDPRQNVAMKVTTRGRYAVTALLDLVAAGAHKPVPLSDIADKSKISLSYLEQLFAALRRHGLVESSRGPGGGYKLSRAPEDISIADILLAAEDTISARKLQSEEYDLNDHEKSSALWEQIGHMLHLTLNRITLRDLIADGVHTHPHLNKIFESLN